MRLDNPVCAPNLQFTEIIGIALSAHNVISLAVRVLQDGRRKGDGLLRTFGKTFVGVTAERDEVHYATDTLPDIRERVHALDVLIALARAELSRLDPDGSIEMRNIAQLDQIAARGNPRTLE